jgi:hypothetical protein
MRKGQFAAATAKNAAKRKNRSAIAFRQPFCLSHSMQDREEIGAGPRPERRRARGLSPSRPSLCLPDPGADEKTRTFTPVKEQRPQRCASTNSATSARGLVSDARYLATVAQDEKGHFRPCATHRTGLSLPRPPPICGPAHPQGQARQIMVEWTHIPGLAPYPETLAAMEARAEAMHAARRTRRSGCWNIRRSTPPAPRPRPADLVDADRFPVYPVGRGGQYTYHGPGQRVIYTMLDVKARGQDVRCFVRELERWVIDTLAEFNVTGEIRQGRVGVWVQRPDRPAPTASPPRTRSPPSASSCAAGSASTASRSTSNRT